MVRKWEIPYKTSTDYRELLRQLQQNQLVAGFITDDSRDVLVHIKGFKKSDGTFTYSAGTQGIGYVDAFYYPELEVDVDTDFMNQCTHYNLRWVIF